MKQEIISRHFDNVFCKRTKPHPLSCDDKYFILKLQMPYSSKQVYRFEKAHVDTGKGGEVSHTPYLVVLKILHKDIFLFWL